MSDTKLIDNFERDVLFLRQNMHPLENSGKQIEELAYTGGDDSKIND